jgi:hypothetical protein
MVAIDIIGDRPDGKGARQGNWRSRGEACRGVLRRRDSGPTGAVVPSLECYDGKYNNRWLLPVMRPSQTND